MQAELYVMIDANGGYWVDTDIGDCVNKANEGECIHPTRLLHVVLDVPTPEAVEVTCSVPAMLVPPVKVTVKSY